MKKSLLFLMGQLCLCLCLTVAGGSPVQAQTAVSDAPKNTGTIAGVLLDSLTRKPIAYATVSLLEKGSTQALTGTLTDNDGRFAFSGLPPGNYEVTISFISYQTQTIRSLSVTARDPEVKAGTVFLRPEATQLKEVNVQTLRPTITQEADRTVVSVEGTAMAAGSTAFEVLAKSPGVFIDQRLW